MEFKAVQIIEVNEDGAPLAAIEVDLQTGAQTFQRILPSQIARGSCDDPECDQEFHSNQAKGIVLFEMSLN